MIDPSGLPSGIPSGINGSQGTPGSGGLGSVSGPGSSQGTQGTGAADSAQGAAFKALLEKLEGQARDLALASEQVDGPVELAGAVDNAKNSLEDALSLSDQLLEAYRASRHEGDAPGQGSGNPQARS